MKPSEVLRNVQQFIAQGNYDDAIVNLKQLEKSTCRDYWLGRGRYSKRGMKETDGRCKDE